MKQIITTGENKKKMKITKQSDAQRISKLKKAIADFKSLAYSKEVVEQYERQLNELQESRQAEKESRKAMLIQMQQTADKILSVC